MAQPQYQAQQSQQPPQQPQQPPVPQSQAPAPPFSPPQPTTSPAPTQGFTMPPTKKQRLSPDPRSQPSTPYAPPSYAMSPNSTAPPSATASPHFSTTQLPTTPAPATTMPPQHNSSTPTVSKPIPSPFSAQTPQPQYNSVYANGNNTSSTIGSPMYNSHLHNNFPLPQTPQTPQAQQNYQYQPPPQTPNGLQHNPQIQQHQFQPQFGMPQQGAGAGAGAMGPPTKPVERENANDDQTDVLANAGVDLRAEEVYAMSFYTGSYNSQPSFSQSSVPAGGHAFTQFEPGDASSFYGSGPANQNGEPVDQATQEKLEKEQVDKAWAEAASNLARSREHELSKPHVQVSILWRKMDKIARDNGVVLNTDPGGKMPTLKLASEFRGDVRAQTAVSPQCSLTATNGPFLPADTALADQLALMSLATNQRLRILLEEAFAISRGRRTGADGIVPTDWAAVSAPSQASSSTVIADGAPRNGWETADSPMTIPSRRRNSTTNRLPTPVSDGAKTPAETVRHTNDLVKALRNIATTERDNEEDRLRKRQDRANGVAPRTGSGASGTPANAAAPEPSAKPLTKKEREKQDKGKASLVDNHAQANTTMNIMLGGKKKSKYSWMTGGGGGSGASTPGRLTTQGLPGTPSGVVGMGTSEKIRLTAEGGRPIGGLREHDQPKVEMKDWILALENDGKEVKSLQLAYASGYEKR